MNIKDILSKLSTELLREIKQGCEAILRHRDCSQIRTSHNEIKHINKVRGRYAIKLGADYCLRSSKWENQYFTILCFCEDCQWVKIRYKDGHEAKRPLADMGVIAYRNCTWNKEYWLECVRGDKC